MASQSTVTVKFETKADEKFLMHRGQHIVFNNQGIGTFKTDKGEFDIILFGIVGSPGTKAKITLSVVPPDSLQIKGHPIEGKIAQGKTVWGSSRFFRVK